MNPKTLEELEAIAALRGIEYVAPPEEETDTLRIVRSRLGRTIAIPRDAAFARFADPQSHIQYFEIIKDSTPLIPLEGVLGGGQYVVLEHVQEAMLPPRMMVVKYTLSPPDLITKEAVTDPFQEGSAVEDKKKGLVTLRFEEAGKNSTKLIVESTFSTNKGPVFVRGFIDHVWLNFFERLLVETGEISAGDMRTG